MQMLFQMVDGVPVPSRDTDADGVARIADGANWFTVAQAAAIAGKPEGVLADAWVMASMEWAPKPDTPENVRLPPGCTADDLVTLRETKYRYLSPEHFAYIMSICRRGKISPWGNAFWVELLPDSVTDDLVPVMRMKFNGAMKLAHDTGTFAGCGGRKFEYADDPKLPVACSVNIYRRLPDGTKEAFEGVADWDECVPANISDSLWGTKPRLCLYRRALMEGLRLGFPEVFSGIYLDDEGKPAETDRSKVKPQKAKRTPMFSQEDLDSPKLKLAFLVRLIDYGLSTERKREHFITEMTRRFPGLQESDAPAFWRQSIALLKSDPGTWGATVRPSEVC